MVNSLRSTAAVCAVCFLCSVSAGRAAADGPARVVEGGPVRTAAIDANKGTSDNLSLVLANWTATGREIRSLECRFARYEYDSAHRTETRGQGTIRYAAGDEESSGRALYALNAYPQTESSRSSRASASGRRYELMSAKPEWLYWVSGQIARIDPQRNEFELFEVPDPFRTSGVVEATESFDVLWTRLGCLERQVPGLIETDVDQLQARFDWTLASFDETQIVLQGQPRTAADKRHCSAFYVYLRPDSYLTRGTKLVNSTGTVETVHAFSDMKVNAVPASDSPDWAPNIGRMRLLTAPPLAPPASE